MRHLASIQRILALDPIEGADSIEVASVLGWKCVVKKGEFQVGDTCVYVEIDSVLPDRPEFEFMKPRGMRVRTIKLRGQVSQGLVFPCSILYPDMNHTEGRDVTDQIGITKYDPPMPAQLAGVARGPFPSFLKKADEDRIQSFLDIITRFPDAVCRVCEKLDGSSATFYFLNGEFGVCSRNLELKETEGNSFWEAARNLKIEEKLRELGMNIAIQGELIGEGVQGNKYKLKGRTVKFFDVFDIDAYKPLNITQADSILDRLELERVPTLYVITLGKQNLDGLIALSKRQSVINPDVLAEGIVVRSFDDMTETFITNKTVSRGRVSFKVINPDFLLKNNE